MSIKIVGIFIIAASCCAIGFLQASGINKEVRQLYDLHRILEYMECELAFRLTPLPKLCCLASRQGESLQTLFQDFAAELENQVSPNPAICMDAVLENRVISSGSVQILLRELGNTFGLFDLNGQLNGISSVKARCGEQLAQLEANKDIRVRNYRTLGLCAGAVVTILLL